MINNKNVNLPNYQISLGIEGHLGLGNWHAVGFKLEAPDSISGGNNFGVFLIYWSQLTGSLVRYTYNPAVKDIKGVKRFSVPMQCCVATCNSWIKFTFFFVVSSDGRPLLDMGLLKRSPDWSCPEAFHPSRVCQHSTVNTACLGPSVLQSCYTVSISYSYILLLTIRYLRRFTSRCEDHQPALGQHSGQTTNYNR